MNRDGLGKKLAFAAAAVGAVLLVLRVVGGRGSQGIDEDAIDRVDTGRSDDGGEGSPVETGLDRVSTGDEGSEGTGDGTDADGTDVGGTAADEEDDEGGADPADPADGAIGATDEAGSDEISVETTGGRFAELDLFDYVAIAGAAFEAAREEYRNRS